MAISLDDYDQNISMVAACMATKCVGITGCGGCVAYANNEHESMTVKEFREYQLNQLIGIEK
jgi:hypothetical protein